jgi:hypothetical protein
VKKSERTIIEAGTYMSNKHGYWYEFPTLAVEGRVKFCDCCQIPVYGITLATHNKRSH